VITNIELPEGWRKTTIGEVSEVLAGFGFPKHGSVVTDTWSKLTIT
jgi:hypothetical protein